MIGKNRLDTECNLHSNFHLSYYQDSRAAADIASDDPWNDFK